MTRDNLLKIRKAKSTFGKLIQQGKFDELMNFVDEGKPMFELLAQDIDIQRKRIGGNFVVAYALNSQGLRDYIREILPDVIFITLSMSRESQKKRILARHGENEENLVKILTGLYDIYELPGKNEKNTFNVDITEDMTPNDVVKKVQDILNDKYITCF